MSGKRMKKLRRIAEGKTIGEREKIYMVLNPGRTNAHVKLSETCTRSVYQRSKKEAK